MPIRVVVQGIDQVSLLVDNEERYVRAGRGVMIYIAFLKSSTDHSSDQPEPIDDAALEHAISVLLKTRIFTHFSPEKMLTRPQSLEESPLMDVVIVPQASLGGKIKKGHSVQMHQLVDYAAGKDLYQRFCHMMRVARGVDENTVDINGAPLLPVEDDESASQRWIKYNNRVVCGTFGNRQGIKMETDGPFTHFFDI